MIGKYLLTAAAIAVLMSGPSYADHRDSGDHAHHSPEQHKAASSAPAKIVDAFAVALASKDERLVRKLLAADALIAEGGGAERSFEEYVHHHMGADMLFMSGVKSKLISRDEFVSGDIAVVISESEVEGSYLTKPVRSRMMETMVLRKSGDDWRIRHIHWSSKDL